MRTYRTGHIEKAVYHVEFSANELLFLAGMLERNVDELRRKVSAAEIKFQDELYNKIHPANINLDLNNPDGSK